GRRAADARGEYHGSPVPAVRCVPDRPLKRDAAEQDEAHEQGDARRVEPDALREHRAEREERAVREPGDTGARDAERRDTPELAAAELHRGGRSRIRAMRLHDWYVADQYATRVYC